jgi:cation:H+ antiporter
MPSALLIVAGLAGLLVGADLLVRGGAALASHLGVRPIVVGLTVVALGTSLPELAVGIDSVRQGSPGLAVGNIVGTNLVNILLILGVSALIRPIAFERRTLRFDLPAMTGASLALWLLARDGSLTRVEGTILCLGGVAYTAGIVWTSRREAAPVHADYASHSERGRRGLVPRALTVIAGIGLVLVGAELLVDGSIEVARSLEVSEATIGLTVIAIGTSAPELVTTLTSTVRGDRDIAVGNLLGSTVYNIDLPARQTRAGGWLHRPARGGLRGHRVVPRPAQRHDAEDLGLLGGVVRQQRRHPRAHADGRDVQLHGQQHPARGSEQVRSAVVGRHREVLRQAHDGRPRQGRRGARRSRQHVGPGKGADLGRSALDGVEALVVGQRADRGARDASGPVRVELLRQRRRPPHEHGHRAARADSRAPRPVM